jgi:glycosyltransferase involved in cell wall biosynthesis
MFALADHLVRRGYLASMAALHTRDPKWDWYWTNASVQVRVFFSETPGNTLSTGAQFVSAVLRLRNLLTSQQFNLLCTIGGPTSDIIGWLATRSLPGTILAWRFAGSGARKRLRRRTPRDAMLFHVCRRVSASVPLFISCSEAGLANRIASGYRCQRSTVIPIGIDVAQFRPDEAAGLRMRHEWAVPEDRNLIGLVGSLGSVKDHPSFLKAAALLLRERPDVRFVCVGDGPPLVRNELRQMGDDLGLRGSLTWAGARNDMPAVYNALDVLCSASLSEGAANVLVEAMACGVPCVVTDVGDSARIVADQGIVVPAGDPPRLAEGLKSMLQELHRVNPHLLRERVAGQFSMEAMLEATEHVLLDACGEGA